MTAITRATTQMSIPSGSDTSRQLLAIMIELVALMVLLTAVVAVVFIDIHFLQNGLSEMSLTELLQSTLIFASAGMFAGLAYRDANSRGCFIAVTTLFACMFIRENDAILDHIRHGFWVVPAGIVAICGATWSYFNKTSLLNPFLRYFTDRQVTFIYIGFLLLMVFSRLFGTGSLWQSIMGAEYNASVKTVVQEGLELLGYAFIAYGSFMFLVTPKTVP